MTDPLSITAAAVGITSSALASISKLHELVSNLTNATSEAKDIACNLEGITHSLGVLQRLDTSDDTISAAAREELKRAHVAEAVNKCGKVCERFSRNLEVWAKCPNGSDLSFRGRFSIGIVHKEKIRTFKTQVQSCRDEVLFAIQVTHLSSQFRLERALEVGLEHVNDELLALATQIREQVNRMKVEDSELNKREQELERQAGNEIVHDDERDEVLEQIEKQRELLATTQASCEASYAKVQNILIDQKIGKVMTSQNSAAKVGVSKDVVGRIIQRIGDVTTDSSSSSYVGLW